MCSNKTKFYFRPWDNILPLEIVSNVYFIFISSLDYIEHA